jgi:hypothetical protein
MQLWMDSKPIPKCIWNGRDKADVQDRYSHTTSENIEKLSRQVDLAEMEKKHLRYF